jgi:gamma-glutamyltranspeptidase/glutathione hydrolase
MSTSPVADWLSRAHVSARRAQITELARSPGPAGLARGGTVYLCTADRDGMMVSYIQSNYMGFGSGIVVPQFGVALQNRAPVFTLEREHPNFAAPGKTPGLRYPGHHARRRADRPPFRGDGGEMQPQGQLKWSPAVLRPRLDTSQAALDAPRFRCCSSGLDRQRSSPRMQHGRRRGPLRGRGHHVQGPASILQSAFRRGQMIWRLAIRARIAVATEPRCGWRGFADW